MRTGELARALDATLWEEAVDVRCRLASRYQDEFEHLHKSIALGGAAQFEFLYFIARMSKPTVCVETGVAVGWSSAAILAALDLNGQGRLWSSELVYDRPWIADDYSQFVGLVVDERLRGRWRLLLDGDREKPPKLVGESGAIQLFHYDSDKSYAGREHAISCMQSALARDAILVIDDTNDNLHFRDYGVTHGGIFDVIGKAGVVWRGHWATRRMDVGDLRAE